MTYELFSHICTQAKDYTKEIYLHILGDPLTLSNLQEYINIAHMQNLKINITTSGFYIDSSKYELLTHKSIKQINFSLNSYNANKTTKSFDEYINNILEFCKYKISSDNNLFVNLRLWNLDENNSSQDYNKKVFNKLKRFFSLTNTISQNIDLRLDNKVKLCFDNYFEWPNLNNTNYGEDGYCLGLKSHIAIDVEGRVVPCCLDKDSIMTLGDIKKQTLFEILNSTKSKDIINSFKKGKAIEELCQKCSYKQRFKG